MSDLINDKRTRNANIELLRIFFMFVILFHHFFSHGLNIGRIGSEEVPINPVNNINASLCLLTHFGVIGFMFISSYYGINLRISKVCKLWVQLLFYSLIIFIGYSLFYHSFSINQFILSLLPLRIWWFVKCYFFVMLLSPIINAGISNIKKQTFLFIVVSIGVILYFSRFILKESSFNLELLLYIYILGRYLRHYPIYWLEKYCDIILFVNSIILFTIPLLLLAFHISSPLRWLWSSYNILVLIEAISCFYTFLHHKPFFKSSFSINISSNVLAVYLITDHPIIRELLWSNINGVTYIYNSTGSLFVVIAVLFVVFGICLVIDRVRQYLMRPIERALIRLDSLLT